MINEIIGIIICLYLIFGVSTAVCFLWENQNEKWDIWEVVALTIALLLPPLYWFLYYLDGVE